jgi:hypothetical protein
MELNRISQTNARRISKSMKVTYYLGYSGGVECDYTSEFTSWMERELSKRIKPSKAFRQAYPTMKRWEFWMDVSPNTLRPEIDGPFLVKKDKMIQFFISLHHDGRRPRKPIGYAKQIKSFLQQVVVVLEKVGIDTSQLLKDVPGMLDQFISTPEMIDTTNCGDPRITDVAESQEKTGHSLRRRKKRKIPQWRIPKGLEKMLESEGEWESTRWDPMLLTVSERDSSSNENHFADWQIEINMGDERLGPLKDSLADSGHNPGGYGLTELIEEKFAKCYPKLAGELDSDPEMSTCVLSVKSEEACKKLVELVWSLIYPKPD